MIMIKIIIPWKTYYSNGANVLTVTDATNMHQIFSRLTSSWSKEIIWVIQKAQVFSTMALRGHSIERTRSWIQCAEWIHSLHYNVYHPCAVKVTVILWLDFSWVAYDNGVTMQSMTNQSKLISPIQRPKSFPKTVPNMRFQNEYKF